MKKLIAALLLSCVTYLPAFADMVHIPADQDTTLIEDADGALSNGAGPAVFAGRTNQSMFSIRRALLRFDVAAALPENALIDRVFLTLYQGSNNVTPSDVSLHLVLADWGEGASFSGGGGGAAAPACWAFIASIWACISAIWACDSYAACWAACWS